MTLLTRPRDSAAIGREAVAASLRGKKTDVPNTLFKYGNLSALLVSLGILVVLVGSVLGDSLSVFSARGLDFLTSGNSADSSTAGMWQAIWGSAWIALIVVMVAFPLGIAAAVYIEEYATDTWFTKLIAITVRTLEGVPSIVYGLLGFTIFVKVLDGFTGGRTVIAGGLSLAVLVLSLVIITTMEALRAVPDSIREAGFGVGAARWEVTRSHVLPYAAPGIITGTILALARALGEAAPLILVGASVGFFETAASASTLERIQGAFTAMPNITFSWARQPGADWEANTSAAILVMLVIIFSFNVAAILLRARFDRKREY